MKFSQAHPLSWMRIAHGLFGLLLLSVLAVGFAQQDSITRVTAVKLEPSKPPAAAGWNLAAEFDIELGHKLREAVDRGLPLQFAVDFKLMRSRWYWVDEEVVSTTYPLSLSYIALTRTYRVVTPANTYNAPTLEDAMQYMTKVRDWGVISRDRINIGQPYQAQVRFRLLLTELPKPFQISALVNSEWDLSSEWLTFDFTPKREALK
ncbi:MAG: DUF4390 domain-containing protein [Gammaproteobacteria bacterium]|uniref:DUF4390 domain-containing protein n=1 Tax=Limnobacter sp. TaxID=2003368 RepID=UPI001DBA6AF9|nr:DUF4390 domain-containing protein [Limnobacter sp.]MBU0785162.1 DUF4390 domain-containing protein [Gammaproteobacteria bacterium]MBU0849200.1 DUF4390 domain-containing protein [Gammaproteobacteria bacterium]MBU1267951.1 DUF4390 domain-containing protein [Gammaproteobacteria bacterium]MBU1528294.1 DUF4390 domain-containing protein [Gammaproteobacteria bacterium]MBU1781537.1 DUF4390 domain-containing protein [Gammaproteobacteria bacterium]